MGKKINELTSATAGAADLLELSRLSPTVTYTATTLSALASDNSFNDSAAQFIAEGFAVGMSVKVAGFTGNVANNIFTGRITALTTAKMTIGGTDGDVIVDDAAGESVTITAWESRRTTAQEVVTAGQGAGLDVDAAGFRGIPQNSQSGNYTTVAADAGKHLLHPSGAGSGDTFTIDSNANVAHEVGTAITFVNMAADDLDIAITSDTLTWAEDGSTGTRTLAQYGVATALKVTSTGWLISGTGLS
jgi:hypothetical protein